MSDSVPSFYLYGEPPRLAQPGFLHLESLGFRSRPSGWTIPPHRHPDLNHVFFLTSGGGVIHAEGGAHPFEAPALLFIPAGAAHGFDHRRESTGHVLTLATAFLQSRPACEEALATLFGSVNVVACGGQAETLRVLFGELAQELAWHAPGHAATVEARVLEALAIAIRLQHHASAARSGGGRDEALVARFRERVELHLRRRLSLAEHAEALGVSLRRLHQACRQAAGATPLGLIQDRLLLEAKRGLLYSDLSIAELALDLGFDDPAYFSRFFAKHAGVSAKAFRAERAVLVG